MKMLKYRFKKRAENITELDTVELWVVKWVSASLDRSFKSDGTKWSPTTNIELKAFTSEVDANLFMAELDAAFKLTAFRRSNIWVYKQESHTNI